MLGVTASPVVRAEFAHRLAANISNLEGTVSVTTVFAVDRDINAARHQLMDMAAEEDFLQIVMLDDSVDPHPFALGRIMSGEHHVVGMNYLVPVMGGVSWSARQGVKPVATQSNWEMTEKVDSFGLLFFRVSLDKKFREWYGKSRHMFHALDQKPEDTFASMVRDSGRELYIDHGLSNVCGVAAYQSLYPKHAEA